MDTEMEESVSGENILIRIKYYVNMYVLIFRVPYFKRWYSIAQRQL